MRPSRVLIPLLLCLIGRAAWAAGVLPQGRWGCSYRNPIEVAVTGLPEGETAAIALRAPVVLPVKFNVTGDGGTVYECNHYLVLVGTSELLLQVADLRYPGPGKALLQFAWSPFALGKHVIFIGASDDAGLEAGLAKLVELIP